MRSELQEAIEYFEMVERNNGPDAMVHFGPVSRVEMLRQYNIARTALTALREKAERERGCAYCVIGKRSPDAEYCTNCGRKLTPTLPELANESEEVNPDSHQYVENYSTKKSKTVFAKTATTANKGNHIRKNRRMCELRRARNEQAGSDSRTQAHGIDHRMGLPAGRSDSH